ncbi:hypothetical protein GOV11_04385 [Candidatus Woesearchaeota archaeon]|nr:hypothetical protein [Candidatus Woesearchaeota archaeon]
MRSIIYALLFIVLAGSAMAACPPDITARNTPQLMASLPSIDSQLQGCPVALPRGASTILGDGNTVLNVQMDDGSLMSASMTIKNKAVTGIKAGGSACKYQLTTSQKVVDSVLSSSNRGQAALYWLGQKSLRINGCSWWTRFKAAITRPIGTMFARRAAPTQPPAAAGGKPANCDETFLPGHQGYAQNKALWDGYSANADKVCQSQYGRGIPSPCVHSVQLSVSGNPYYLCWYNE